MRLVAERALTPRRLPQGLSLRARRADDLGPLIGLLSQDDFQRNGSTLDPLASVEDMAGYLAREGPGVFEIVAVLEDLIVGFAGLYAFAGRQCHIGSCTIAVHELFQRKGIGATLLHALIATARDIANLNRVQLTVFVDNTRAISLYRKAGFHVEGRLRNFACREDGYVDAFLMAWYGPQSSPEKASPKGP
jgi:putative acetyltransferase